MDQKLIEQTEVSKYTSAPKIIVKDGTIAPDGGHYSNIDQFLYDAMMVTGTRDDELAFAMLNQMARMQGRVSQHTEHSVNNVMSLLAEFKCQNPQEAMIASHLIALHSHIAKLFTKASNEPSFELQKKYYEMALKISRAFANTMELLQKYRRNGIYKMKVEHLHVHNGAQAIIGTVNQTDTTKGRGGKI